MNKYEIYDSGFKLYSLTDKDEAIYYYLNLYYLKLQFLEKNNINVTNSTININLYISVITLCGSTYIETNKLMIINSRLDTSLKPFNQIIMDKIFPTEKSSNNSKPIVNPVVETNVTADDVEHSDKKSENKLEQLNEKIKQVKNRIKHKIHMGENIEKETELINKMKQLKKHIEQIEIDAQLKRMDEFRKKEKLIEDQRIFDSDKKLYFKFKNDKVIVPELFQKKYKVFEILETNNLLDNENVLEFYKEEYDKIKDDLITIVDEKDCEQDLFTTKLNSCTYTPYVIESNKSYLF